MSPAKHIVWKELSSTTGGMPFSVNVSAALAAAELVHLWNYQ